MKTPFTLPERYLNDRMGHMLHLDFFWTRLVAATDADGLVGSSMMLVIGDSVAVKAWFAEMYRPGNRNFGYASPDLFALEHLVFGKTNIERLNQHLAGRYRSPASRQPGRNCQGPATNQPRSRRIPHGVTLDPCAFVGARVSFRHICPTPNRYGSANDTPRASALAEPSAGPGSPIRPFLAEPRNTSPGKQVMKNIIPGGDVAETLVCTKPNTTAPPSDEFNNCRILTLQVVLISGLGGLTSLRSRESKVFIRRGRYSFVLHRATFA